MKDASLTTQTPQQLELLRQNPDLVRQRIQQSGMSADQVRARLRAEGYLPSPLDAFLGAAGSVAMRFPLLVPPPTS